MATEPIYTPTTERVYYSLPEFYRIADAKEPSGYPLKRYVSLICDPLDVVNTYYDRIDFVSLDEGGVPGDTSDLASPTNADDPWLLWLAQLYGVVVPQLLRGQAVRNLLLSQATGYHAGSKNSMALAAKQVLTGSQFVMVYDHSDDVNPIGSASMWDVLIVTRADETAGGPSSVVNTIISQGAKPAGVTLHSRSYAATWDTLATYRPTWNDWEAAGSWDNLQNSGLS